MHHNGRAYELRHRLETTDKQPTVHGETVGGQTRNRTVSGALVMTLVPLALVAAASVPAVAGVLAVAVATTVGVTLARRARRPGLPERDVPAGDPDTPVTTLPD